ncbi:MAG: IS4 family transposase [Nostochopsis sp.]
MLPLLYQQHLEKQFSRSEILLLTLLINVLQNIKKVSLEKLATILPIPILFESRRKKIQRFISLPSLSIEKVWFPIIKTWLIQDFEPNQVIYVVIDRTSWACVNLLMIRIIYEQRSIPIYFELLPKLGSTNFTEQTKSISQVLPLFTQYKTCLLGDREFCSVKLANWVRQNGLYFCLRLKKSEFIQMENGIWLELNELGIKPGISLFIQGVNVTKSHQMQGFNLACKWKRMLNGSSSKEGWFILTNFSSHSQAINAYKKRFGIEEMFRDFKSGGYNLEESKISEKRLISLILIVAFAYSLATFQGQNIKKKGIQKYIARVKEYGRNQRRHSSFYIGLYGKNWVDFMADSWNIVEELMKINRSSLKYYLRGLRAMDLILKAS